MKKSLAILLVMALMLSSAWVASATGVTVSAVPNGTEVTVSGTITGGGTNQQITIMVVKGNVDRTTATASEIAYINQDTFADNSYSFTFEMPNNMTTGTYDAYIGGTGVSPAVKTSFTLGSATEAPTQAPTEEPTEAPTEEPATGVTVTGNIAIDTTKYTVTATANGEPVDITVAANGDYTITLPAAGDYTIVIDAPTMLDYSFNVTEAQGSEIEGPEITPILGDIDGNNQITYNDVNRVIGKLGASTGASDNWMCDIDGNNQITYNDVNKVIGKLGAHY